MAVARVWDEEWSPIQEYRRHLELVSTPAQRTFSSGRAVSLRRAARERMLRRRRRAMLALGIIVSLVILAWPGHAFGGVTGSGTPADQAINSSLTSGMVYVVHNGDTVSSIARLIDPSRVAQVRGALVRELHSTVVVPGEHVLIP